MHGDAQVQPRGSHVELCDLVGTLVAKVAEHTAALASVKAENQALRDEVARLKGLPPRPPSRPSGMEKATGGGAGQKRQAVAAPSATGRR